MPSASTFSARYRQGAEEGTTQPERGRVGVGLIVSSFPLISELAPGARGTLMALNVAALSAGRMAGSLTATHLWLRGGLSLNAVVSCGAALGAFALLLLFVPEPGGSLELER